MKKRLMSLLLVCSMILSLFTGLSVTALAAGTGPAAATPTPTVASAFESRVYLKTPNAPGQRTFSRCAAPFFLEIRQYSCEKMSCSAQKFLAAGHIGSFQIHPSNGEITGFDFSVENVVIPASINGVTVTKIGQSAFLYTGLDSGISTIVVPSTVTFVGDYAFGYNELLECDLFLTEKVRR